jgi:hypothetical protein
MVREMGQLVCLFFVGPEWTQENWTQIPARFQLPLQKKKQQSDRVDTNNFETVKKEDWLCMLGARLWRPL